MNVYERRGRIIKILTEVSHVTVNELAKQFGVSYRTITRDLEFLSEYLPIYTVQGRTVGGIYLCKNKKTENSN